MVRGLALSVVLLAAAALLVFFGFCQDGCSAESPLNQRYQHWSERISALGGKAAYAEMSQEIATSTINEQHVQAHAFGGALYATLGLPGLGVCDSRFSFGCFHEFLGAAIAEKGIGSVADLNKACETALVGSSPLSCQHGIGHGIQSYLGYDDDALIEGLRLCRDLKNDRIGGCYGGVFMEFYLQTMLGDAAHARPTTFEHAADICNSIESDFKGACLYWSPQWWHQVIYRGEPKLESFERLGAICRGATSDSSLLRDCFEGMGTIVPSTAAYDASLTRRLCDATSKHELDRLYCRSTAAGIFFVEVDEAHALEICQGYNGEALAHCRSYARNQANIFDRAPEVTDL